MSNYDKVNEIKIKLGLAQACDQTANIIREPARVQVPSDPSDLRVFVKNLRPETTEATLKNYFSRWGTVVDVLIRKPLQPHRGFVSCAMGFITFSSFFTESPLRLVVHIIDGMSVPIFKVQVVDNDKREVVAKSHTLMITGTIQNLEDIDLVKYFSKFGKIINMRRKRNETNTGKFERFAFISFNDTRSVDQAVEKKTHVVKRQIIDSRRVKDK